MLYPCKGAPFRLRLETAPSLRSLVSWCLCACDLAARLCVPQTYGLRCPASGPISTDWKDRRFVQASTSSVTALSREPCGGRTFALCGYKRCDAPSSLTEGHAGRTRCGWRPCIFATIGTTASPRPEATRSQTVFRKIHSSPTW
jgi:hypothetical protein